MDIVGPSFTGFVAPSAPSISGSAFVPSFRIPVPGGQIVTVNLIVSSSSPYYNEYKSLQWFVRMLCYLTITAVFFLKTLKLFRKNS